MGGNDLDMIQYYQLVGTCRVPNKNKDDIKIMHLKDINVKINNHIIVMFNDNVSFELLN